MSITKKKRIFILEDEPDIIKMISYNLQTEGFQLDSESDGDKAIKKITELNPDLILVDIMVPNQDSFEICKQLKADKDLQTIPVIMLTAKSQEHHVITGLEIGADDYMTKPFSIHILIAKIRSLLRRHDLSIKKHDRLGFKIIPEKLALEMNNEEIQLKLTEFKLLETLAEKPGWVFSRQQLLDAIKGPDAYITDRSIDVLVVALRKKLGIYGKQIETVRGLGYKMKELA